MRRFLPYAGWGVAASASVLWGCASANTNRGAPRTDAPLRVMSFNIRYNNPGDGVNAWPNRRDWVAEIVRAQGTDVVGVQEALGGMLVDLDARLPGFARVGVGRTDGVARGEFSAILYRTERLEAERSGTFWLSPTPNTVASRGWDAALERIATYAVFRDKMRQCRFMHLNTHFDHMGALAREESAKLLRRQLSQIAPGLPIVLTGDLNDTPQSAAYRVLTRDTMPDAVAALHDAFSSSRAGHEGPTSTWNAFKAIEPERRIDFIMTSSPVTVHSHRIIDERRNGLFPSDHLPVTAMLTPCR